VVCTLEVKGDVARLRVADDGPGIPPKELEKVFIPFYTTKHHGTGIGLSLSRTIQQRPFMRIWKALKDMQR